MSLSRDRILAELGRAPTPAENELIDRFEETAAILDRIQAEIAVQPLMMEYTNKAGATNLTKNPLLGEIPRYNQTLAAILKALNLTGTRRKTPVPDDDFDSF